MKKKIYTAILILSILLGVVVSSVSSANAQSSGTGSQPGSTGTGPAPSTPKVEIKNTSSGKLETIGNPLKAKDIQELLIGLVDIAIYVGTLFATLMIIYTGFKYILARGNPEKIKEVHNMFLYVIIGIAILLGSKIIIEIIRNTVISAGVVNESLFK